MGRIIKEIEIEGKPVFALFDTGSTNTYVEKRLLPNISLFSVPEPYRGVLGGKVKEVREVSLIRGKIESLGFDIEAIPIDEIGKIDGRGVAVIIGALTMEKWEIRLDPKSGELDLTGLRRREFTEYYYKRDFRLDGLENFSIIFYV